VGMFSRLMAQSSAFVMEGVKNLVVKRHNLPITKVVEELMEVKNMIIPLSVFLVLIYED